MPKWGFPFSRNGLGMLKVQLSIHGHQEEVSAFIDTGFSGDASGIKVPTSFVQYTQYRLVSNVIVASGDVVPIAYIPDGRILSIEGKRLNAEVPIMFLDGPQVMGCYLLQNGVLSVNGKKGKGKLKI